MIRNQIMPLSRTKTTIGLERPIEVFIYSFWPPAVVCHRGPPSTARAQVDHRTEIVAKLLKNAPAKPAHRDSKLIVSIEGFQGCGVAGSGRKSYLNVQQNAYSSRARIASAPSTSQAKLQGRKFGGELARHPFVHRRTRGTARVATKARHD